MGHFDGHSRLLRAGAIGCALLLSACGGDDETASVDTVPPVSQAPTTVATTTTTSAAPTTTTTTIAVDFEGAPAFDSASSVSTVGIDAVNFGMTLATAESAVSALFVPVSEPVDPLCHTFRPAGGPEGVILTVTEGTVERVDITNPSITTRSGAGVGMSEQGVLDLFGERVALTERDSTGNTITFTPADAADAEFRVIFETDGAVVTSFRSGRLPQVSPLNPCG